MTLVDQPSTTGAPCDGAGALRSLAPRCAISQTTSQMADTMVVMTKLGGTLNIADTARPAHTETTASPGARSAVSPSLQG